MERILSDYYQNNAKKLHRTVDKILLKYGGISDKDLDDFYSLANEVFVEVMGKFDDSQSFDAFLYSCLSNRIKTEITRRNREKRKADRMSVPIDMPVGEDGDLTLTDLIADDFIIEQELIEKKENGFSRGVLAYLDRLSDLQKEVLRLNMAGYLPGEVREELHISAKQYEDCYAAIRSYRNVQLIFVNE